MDPWELANWDAVETALRITRRDVTPVEVVEAALKRAEDCRGLNAVVTPTPDQARARAQVARGAMAGVPTYTKDLVPTAGVRTCWGTSAVGEVVPKKSVPTVAWLEQRGLVSLGKSATPEFGLTATTEPSAFGPTQNPAAPGHTPGGSSGGAGALVAAGVVPLAHGSDGGGSIRIPAACCGLVGLKPTRGRFDMEGSNLLPVNIAVHGVLTRTVRDTAAFWGDVIAPAPPRRLKILSFVDAPIPVPVDGEVSGAVQRVAKTLRELGHEVREEPCPISTQVVDDFTSLWAYVAWVQCAFPRIAMGVSIDRSKLEPLTVSFGAHFTKNKWRTLSDIRRLRRWTSEYGALLDSKGIDVLLCPTLARPPPKLGHLSPREPFEVAMQRLREFVPFTGMFNSSGAPSLSLPLAKTTSGLPIGVMISAARGRDAMLLELGAELERALPWARPVARPVTG